MFFKKHETTTTLWRLKKGAGPQSAADQGDESLVNYLGSPRLFMWYSAVIFKDELATKFPGVCVEAVSERDFLDLLQRTSTRASNHGVVRSYFVAFSGPQSWIQRSDARMMAMEPRVEGRRVEYRPKEFEWLECGTCGSWRRVDLATARVFSNSYWRRHEYEERMASLRTCFPRLSEVLRMFLRWDGGSAAARGSKRSSVDMPEVAEFLRQHGLEDALAPDHSRALLALVADECRQANRPCAGVRKAIEEEPECGVWPRVPL